MHNNKLQKYHSRWISLDIIQIRCKNMCNSIDPLKLIIVRLFSSKVEYQGLRNSQKVQHLESISNEVPNMFGATSELLTGLDFAR